MKRAHRPSMIEPIVSGQGGLKRKRRQTSTGRHTLVRLGGFWGHMVLKVPGL